MNSCLFKMINLFKYSWYFYYFYITLSGHLYLLFVVSILTQLGSLLESITIDYYIVAKISKWETGNPTSLCWEHEQRMVLHSFCQLWLSQGTSVQTFRLSQYSSMADTLFCFQTHEILYKKKKCFDILPSLKICFHVI